MIVIISAFSINYVTLERLVPSRGQISYRSMIVPGVIESEIMRTRVKICGITTIADAQAVVNAGADAIGLVFYKNSKRCVSVSQAREISASLPAFVTLVGLFVNASVQEIHDAHAAAKFDLVQYHGDEDPMFCQSVALPYIKAVRVKNPEIIAQACNHYSHAKAILADAYVSHQQGGTGQQFDWNLLPKQPAAEIILAGGLNPDNVISAIQQVLPYAVDVSSGVEASPGIKDPEKIQRFMTGVKHADRNR